MNKVDLVAVLAALASPFGAFADEHTHDESDSPDEAETLAPAEPPQPAAVVAFDPNNPDAGTLPAPVVQGPGRSDVPKGAIFIVLPFIGLWLILRRRQRSVGH